MEKKMEWKLLYWIIQGERKTMETTITGSKVWGFKGTTLPLRFCVLRQLCTPPERR